MGLAEMLKRLAWILLFYETCIFRLKEKARAALKTLPGGEDLLLF